MMRPLLSRLHTPRAGAFLAGCSARRLRLLVRGALALALLVPLAARPAAAQTVCPDSYTLSTQAEVDAFAALGCTSVTGTLQISGGSITNLSGLSTLTSVGGGLNISNNAALTSLDGLDGITSLGRFLTVLGNASLTSLDGLSSLTSVGGGLTINSNAALTSLDGLANIPSVGGSLNIRFNDVLASLDGLNGLTSVGITLRIERNAALTSLDGLDGLTSVGSFLIIEDNDALTSLDGLNNVTSVGSGLFINNNVSLVSLDGLSSLTFVGSDLLISSNPELNAGECGLRGLVSLDPPAWSGVTGRVLVNSNGGAPFDSPANLLAAIDAGCVAVTFAVDGSFLGLAPGEVLALRGSLTPLSFEQSFPLADDDGDGIWTGTVVFDASLAGTELQYKFVRHSATQYGLSSTDLGILGGFEGDVGPGDSGNRVLTLPAVDTVLPVVFFNNQELGTCDGVPRITSEVLDTDANTVTVTFFDGDGLTEINFTNRDTGDPALNNLDVLTAEGFESANGILWTPTGEAPTESVFVLKQVDTQIPEGSYFALITDGCALGPEVFYADPILRMGADAAAEPVAFGLSAAYPNPFASRTTIGVAVAEASDVRVVVYDVLGRQVAVLVDGYLPAGRHDVQWNGRSANQGALSSGVYFVHMRAGAFTATSRLLLVQ